jgi:hypothetical protein
MTRLARWAASGAATMIVVGTPNVAVAAYTAPTAYEAAVHRCLLEHNQFWHVEEVEEFHPDGTITIDFVCVPLHIPLYG